jgi:hypothetical protein
MDIQAYEWISWGMQFSWYILATEYALFSLMLVSLWKIFEKSGINAWIALIPLVNIYFFVRIEFKKFSWFYFLLFFIPIINIIIWLIFSMRLSHSFLRSKVYGFFLFLLPLIFIPHLAFSKQKVSKLVREEAGKRRS